MRMRRGRELLKSGIYMSWMVVRTYLLLNILFLSQGIAFPWHSASKDSMTGIAPIHVSDEGNSVSRALWFQFGLGPAKADLGPNEFFHGEMSLLFRPGNKAFSIGFDSNGTETWGIDAFWGAYGYSFHDPFIDATLSSGLSLTQWYHYTESGSLGTLRSKYVPGILVKAQVLPHFRFGLGVGIVFTFNYNKEVEYHAVSLILALGHWNW